MTQVMIDKVFSFGELGFQEFETSKYLSKILEENGFDVEYQISGIPTSWLATWSNGEGGPTIALGSDFDGVPSTSQYPGVAYEKPVVEGAPGHGEGHNIGLPIVITSAISIKKIMIENNINGTLVLWPGVAEKFLVQKLGMLEMVILIMWICVFSLMSVQICLHLGVDLQVQG